MDEMNGPDEPITEFRGEHRFLSNFSEIGLRVEGVIYPTLEHAYQAMKTSSVAHRRLIAGAKTPGRAKRLGRHVPLVADWDAIKLDVMYALLQLKFHEPHYKRKLLETGGREIVEENGWGDRFWGVDRKTGEGENNLGKLLMRVREELKLEKMTIATRE